MRFFHNLALALLVAVVAAQGGTGGEANPFNIPNGGWQVTAGKAITLKWTPTTGGTVTLQLQWGGITTSDQGVTIAANIPNSGSYTWTPSGNLVPEPDFTVKIIDDQDPSKYNFSPRFVISGATGTATVASSTGSSSAAVSSTSGSSSASSSASQTSSASASTSASSSASASSTTSGSSTPSSTPSATPAATTAPNNSGTANAPSALLGLFLGLVALL